LKWIIFLSLVLLCNCATIYRDTISKDAPIVGGFESAPDLYEAMYDWDTCYVTDTIGMTVEIECKNFK